MVAVVDGALEAPAVLVLAGADPADLADRGDRGDRGDPVEVALPSMTTKVPDPTANLITIQFSNGGQLPFTSRTSRRLNGQASPK